LEANVIGLAMNKPVLIGGLALATVLSQFAVAAEPSVRRHDLGDDAAGAYFGNVTSDTQGAGKQGVALTVTRIGKNVVEITSDYPRLPTVDVHLSLASGKILNAGGPTTLFLDPAASPPQLDVTFNNEVSWAGTRR
jgi:hypothetical protein